MKTAFAPKFFQFLLLPLFVFMLNVGWGQVSITGTGSGNTYTQNFNSFAGTSATLPSSWAIAGTVTTYNTTSPIITAGTTTFSNASSNAWSACRPNSTSSDYAIAIKHSTSGSSTLTFSVTNNTGSAITGFVLGWNSEQYTTSARASTLNFNYRLGTGSYGNTGLSGTTLTTATTGTDAVVAANAVITNARSITISGISLASSGTADFRFTIAPGGTSGSACLIGIDDFTMYATAEAATPTITSSGTLSASNTTYGSASATPTSFNVSGANMSAGILVTPPAGYEVCLTSNGTYTSTVTVGTSGTISSTPVYVRLAAATAVGSYSGNIVLSSTSATSVNVATVSSAVSAKALTVQASNQTKIEGNSSPSTGTLNTHYTVSGLANSDAANQVTLSYSGSPSGDQTSATAGSYTITPSDLTFSTGSASNYSITYNTGVLTINSVAAATIDPVTLSSALSSTYGTASTGVSFTASGSNLSGNISATAQADYQVSIDNIVFANSVSISSGTTVYVRFSSAKAAGNYNNESAIVLSSVGASSNANITTSASGNAVLKATPSITSSPTATAIIYGQSLASSSLISGSASVPGTFTFTTSAASPNAGTSNQSVTFTPTDFANYNNVNLEISVIVAKADQAITFSALATKTTADVPFALTATASSGLTVSYTSSNTAAATVSGSTVTIVGAGTTTITASQSGNENFNAAASVSQNLVVTSAPVVLAGWDFSLIVTTNNYGASPMTATTSNSDVTVGGLSRGSGFGTLGAAGVGAAWGATNFTVSGDLAGEILANKYYTLTITANAGKLVTLTSISPYNIRRSSSGPTTGQWQYSLGGGSFVNIGGAITWGTTTTSAGNAQAAIDLSGISALSSVSSNTLITIRLVSYGATNAGGTNYLKDLGNTTGNDLIINGIISIPATPPTLTADATSNTVDNNIDITFTDDATWRSAITAVKIGSTTLTPTTDYIISPGNIQLKPSGLNTLLTVAGTKAITVVATGYSDATLSQAIVAGVPTANSTASINSILAAGATRTITCTAKDQYSNLVSGYTFKYDATIVALNATTSESYAIGGTTTSSTLSDNNLTATTDASGVASFTVQLPSLLDANDGISVQVQLTDGNTNIGSAFAYYELPGQTITFNALNAVTYGDAAFTVSASGGASGNPVVFTSSNNAVATCTGTNGTTVTIIGVGTVSISANQAGNAGYNAAAPVSQTLTVNQKALTISGITGVTRSYNGTTAATFTGIPAYVGLVNGQSFSVSGTATAAFSDANAGTGKTITVTGYVAPSDNYSLTQPTLTADITQASQTITGFSSLPNRAVGGPTYTLNAASTTSATNPISYVSSNTSVATISGNTVTIVGAGSTTITASQAGNINYTSATSVSQTQIIIATPVAAWDFYGQTSAATFAATTFNSNLDATSALSEITRGSGASSNGVANAFSTTGFQNNGISTSNTDYFQVTLKANVGYILTLSEINANFDGTSTFYATSGVTSQYAYSLNGTDFTLIGSPVTSTSLKPAAVDLTGVSALQNLSANTTVTIRYYASGQTTTGGWRFSSPAAGVPGLAVGGSLCLLPTTPLISSTTFCAVGETGSISTTTSELNVNYELYDSNGVVPNSTKSGTGNALTWSNVTDGNYYVVATNPLGACSSTSATLNVTGTIAAYSYYLDSDADGYGTGTALHGCAATAPAGYSLNTGDCNNSNSAYYPTAVEICGNGIDENCSGPSDDAPISYRSVTSGNWGDASTWEMACYAGSAYTAATYAPVSSFTGIASIQSTHEVVIPNNGTIYQTGTLDIDAGGTLTMTGNDYNNAPTTANVPSLAKLTVTLVIINDGTMNVGHQASLVQTATTAGTVNSGSGNFNVQSKLTGNWSSPTGAPNGRYWYIGSPMNNTVASQFFDTPSMVRLWRYNGTNNSWGIVIHSQTSTTSSLKLVPGIGYLYRAGANKTITYTSTAANLNNNITTNLLAPASDAAYIPVLGYSTTGYKYVANPYPSHVDWTLLSRTGLNAGYWIRNAANNSYDAYNATTQQGSLPSGQTTKYIAPMQGFWVYAYTTPNALKIDNTDRVHSTNVLHAPVTNQVVRLKLNNGESSDYTVVYENELAANDFEEADTDKMFDYDFHQLYTLEGEHELVLNGLSNATVKGSVDMGISVANNGQYTIEATDLEVEEAVILEDRFNHTFQDMKVNPIYSFTSQVGTFNERFVLHFTATESVAVGDTETVVDEVRVFNTSNKQVKVWVSNTAEYKGATVKVYDAIGNLVERKNMTSNELLLDLDIANGIYVVEITGKTEVFSKKIFIGK